MLRSISVAVAIVLAFASIVRADDTSQPIDVLLLLGGGYHDFEGNPPRLMRGINQIAPDRMTFHPLWLGENPPEAFRDGPDLSDADVFDRFDVILAYHQGEFDTFTDEVKEGMLDFIRKGGGFVGIHSAADSHPGWSEYDAMLGGRFETHPPFSEITVNVDISQHAITRDLPTEWTLPDEFYHLKNCAEDDKLILMTGRSPGDGEDAPPRPVAWEKNYGEGRVCYTILGHGPEAFSDERFHRLILSAITWAADAPRPNEDGEYVLFDGSSTDGWSMAGPGGFRLEDGELVAYGGMGMLWYHERRFRDFTPTVEWKTEAIDNNSGVFVRFHRPSDDPWYAVHNGHEIQIYDRPGVDETRGTGSVYGFADAQGGASKPPGEWNRYEITVVGDKYVVTLNGQRVLKWTSPTDRHGREGYIGLQNHDDASPVRFRNIRVKPMRER